MAVQAAFDCPPRGNQVGGLRPRAEVSDKVLPLGEPSNRQSGGEGGKQKIFRVSVRRANPRIETTATRHTTTTRERTKNERGVDRQWLHN